MQENLVYVQNHAADEDALCLFKSAYGKDTVKGKAKNLSYFRKWLLGKDKGIEVTKTWMNGDIEEYYIEISIQ